MKRSLFDAEYEKVRRRTAARPRPEFPEAGIDFEQPDRVEAARLDFHRRMEALRAHEAVIDAERKALAADTTARANRLLLLTEYERAGVRPPYVNDDNVPTISLSLLLQRGWKIEEVNGERTLIQPPQPSPHKRKPKEDCS